jgi:hypothetical protein
VSQVFEITAANRLSELLGAAWLLCGSGRAYGFCRQEHIGYDGIRSQRTDQQVPPSAPHHLSVFGYDRSDNLAEFLY